MSAPAPMSDGSILNIALELPPEGRMVSIVRRFVEESFDQVARDGEAVHRLSLAVHELLENAAKYSVGGPAALTVCFDPQAATTKIRLTNRATPAHVARLRACIGEIEAAAEPFAHYQRLMRETAACSHESGLGLARIRAEGNLDLCLEVDGTMVTIVASR